MNNIKTTTFTKLDDAIIIRNDKANVSESVKPFKLKPMDSLNGMKSFLPKRTVRKIKKD